VRAIRAAAPSHCASSLATSCEGPLSETVRHSSCRSSGLARRHRDGDGRCVWAGHWLVCRGRPLSQDTSHVTHSGAVFWRRRHQPRRPALAKIRPAIMACDTSTATMVSQVRPERTIFCTTSSSSLLAAVAAFATKSLIVVPYVVGLSTDFSTLLLRVKPTTQPLTVL
jgi:hypothetical protein